MDNRVALLTIEELQSLVAGAVRSVLDETRAASASTTNASVATKVLTLDEARLRLRVSAPTIRKLVRSGRLKAQRLGRRWIFSEPEINCFIEGNAISWENVRQDR